MIKAVYPGDKTEDFMDLQNAWGTAVVIWSIMTHAYFDVPSTEWLNHLDALWKLAYRKDIPEHHRAVLMMTFDRAFVLRKDYHRAAKDIEHFFDDFPYSSDYVNHWPTIIRVFEANHFIPAIGFHMTSVSVNPFEGPYDEKTETYLPFDWSMAYDVYEELNKSLDEVHKC
jgi:hypothetical protein